MGRNKFSQSEIDQIARLLRLKNAGNRAKQKEIRHELRVGYGFNISDFNEQGKAFGAEELMQAIRRGSIQILDDATIEVMKRKYAQVKAEDARRRKQEAVDNGATDWKEAMKEWQEWEAEQKSGSN